MATPLRFVQLVHRPQPRGAELFARELNVELNRRGHVAHLLYLYDRPAVARNEPREEMLGGDERHVLESYLGFQPRLIRNLADAIRDRAAQIVLAHGGSTLKYAALTRRFAGSAAWRLVYRNIGLPADWIVGWRRRLFYRHVVGPCIDGTVAVSETSRRQLEQIYSPHGPITVIPSGINPETLNAQGARADIRAQMSTAATAPVVLFVGSLSPEKRVDRFITIVEAVRRRVPATQAWIVGDGPLRSELLRQVESLGLQDTISFLGTRSDVASYMHAADLLLLTSDTEGVPRVVLEAGACRLPVVATAVGGVPEAIRHGETGILVDPVAPDALVDAVARLLLDDQSRHRLGHQASEWVRDGFAIRAIAARFESFCSAVAAA